MRRSRRRIVLAAVLFVLLAVAALLAVEGRRRAGHYWYDVGSSYDYRFEGTRVDRARVDLAEDGFVIPRDVAHGETTLLALEVSTTLAGRWFEPSIAISAEGAPPLRQAIERGARGLRYVNVTHAADGGLASGDRVSVRGRHVRWEPQRATLLTFPAPELSRVLVLAPHPDDAEIAAFGLYATHDAVVATLTPGNYADARLGHLAGDPEAAAALQADLRTWDALAVPLWGGVPPGQIVSLGYRSRTLETLRTAAGGARDPGRAEDDAAFFERHRRGNVAGLLGTRTPSQTWSSLVDDIAALIDLSGAGVVVAPHPALDADSDHRATTRALLEALARTGDASTSLLLYTNHLSLAESFPFGPADSLVSLPPWLDPAVRFAGVHSEPLDADLRVRKLYALDAMHDLRDPPHPHLGGPTGRALRRAARALKTLVRDPLQSYSYLRRAPRPNELFFVYGPGERHLLDGLRYGGGREAAGRPPDGGTGR